MSKVNYKEKLQKTKEDLEKQKDAIFNQFQQILGALTVVDGLLSEDKPKKDA